MTISEYHHAANDGFVSPKTGDGKLMSAMHSPRTITLGNQTEAILRSMAADSRTALMMSSTNNKEHLFTQTAAAAAAAQPQLPLLPNIKLSPSRPIRITRRKPVELQPRYANRQGNSEDLLSASPSELKLMYDEATWRMYNLIQTARLEKQASKAAQPTNAPNANNNWPSAGDDYLYDDYFFLEPNTPPAGLPVVSPEDDLEQDEPGEEGVFELDDL